MQMTYAEIAIHIGCSAENIRKIERKALKKLSLLPESRTILAEYMDTPDRCGLWEAIANDEVNIVFTRKRELKQSE